MNHKESKSYRRFSFIHWKKAFSQSPLSFYLIFSFEFCLVFFFSSDSQSRSFSIDRSINLHDLYGLSCSRFEYLQIKSSQLDWRWSQSMWKLQFTIYLCALYYAKMKNRKVCNTTIKNCLMPFEIDCELRYTHTHFAFKPKCNICRPEVMTHNAIIYFLFIFLCRSFRFRFMLTCDSLMQRHAIFDFILSMCPYFGRFMRVHTYILNFSFFFPVKWNRFLPF